MMKMLCTMRWVLAIAGLIMADALSAQTVGDVRALPTTVPVVVPEPPSKVHEVPGGTLVQYSAGVRLLKNGQVDTSFGTNGLLSQVQLSYVYPDGRFFAGLTRFLANGTIDPSFNIRCWIAFRTTCEIVGALPDGRLLGMTRPSAVFETYGQGFDRVMQSDGSGQIGVCGAYTRARSGGYWLLLGNQLTRVSGDGTSRTTTLDFASAGLTSTCRVSLTESPEAQLLLDHIPRDLLGGNPKLRRFLIDTVSFAVRLLAEVTAPDFYQNDDQGNLWFGGFDYSINASRFTSISSTGVVASTVPSCDRCGLLDLYGGNQVSAQSGSRFFRVQDRKFVRDDRAEALVLKPLVDKSFQIHASSGDGKKVLATPSGSPDSLTVEIDLVSGAVRQFDAWVFAATYDQGVSSWHLLVYDSTTNQSSHRELTSLGLGTPTVLEPTGYPLNVKLIAPSLLWINGSHSRTLLEKSGGAWRVRNSMVLTGNVSAVDPTGAEARARACSDDGQPRSAIVTRYLADGSLDSNFGVGGTVTLTALRSFSQPCVEAVESDSVGRTYVSLLSTKQNADGFLVRHIARLTSSGAIDATWGDRGYVPAGAYEVSDSVSRRQTLIAHKDGLLVANPGMRLTANGRVDLSFAQQRVEFLHCRLQSDAECVGVDSSTLISLTGQPALAKIDFVDSDGDGLTNAEELQRGSNWLRGDNDVWGDPVQTARALYRDVLLRDADAGGEAYAVSRLRATSYESLAMEFLNSPEYDANVGYVVRLYKLALGRAPDGAGLAYWAKRRVAAPFQFAEAPEFLARYGQLDDRGFVDRLYLNALGRTASADENSFWVAWMAQRSVNDRRGLLLREFALSAEYRSRADDETFVQVVYALFLKRTLDASGAAYWISRLAQGTPREELIAAIRATGEYRLRFVW